MNPAAYEAWLKGSYHRSRRSADGASECIKYAERAATLDSMYAAAYELLAQCYSIATFVSSAPPAVSFARTKAAARRAIKLDDTRTRAHIALARALAMSDWNWAAAESEYRRALELDSGRAEAHVEYGWFLSWHRRREESLAHLLRAEELDPISPDIAVQASMAFLLSGEVDQALERAQRAVAIDSSFVFAHDRLHWAFDANGATDEALMAASKAALLAGPRDLRRRAFLAYAYARAGQRENAKQILASLLRISRSSYVPPTSIALVYLSLGDKDAAMDFLETAYRDRDGDLVALYAWPIWSTLSSSPRFQSILRRMNFGAVTAAPARTTR